jgi:hypothetical protein
MGYSCCRNTTRNFEIDKQELQFLNEGMKTVKSCNQVEKSLENVDTHHTNGI